MRPPFAVLANPTGLVDPSDYEPFEAVNLCGNTLRNVRYFFEVQSVHPLLIGKGNKPLIWLAAPVDQNRKEWKYVVERSVSLHPAFRISDLAKYPITIHAGSTKVLEIMLKTSGDLEIIALDLRPIGLNITGSKSSLMVGNGKISESSATNGVVFVAVGG